jgi:Terminase large subunit, T4likevirus-type, N-terminal
MGIDNKKHEDNSPEHIPDIIPQQSLEKIKEERRKLETQLRKEGKKPEAIIITTNGDVKKATDLNYEEQESEIVKCASNPIYFIETYLTIFDQTKGEGGQIVPFKLFPDQKDLIDMFLGERFVVANKYRQAGISTTTCAYIAWYICFKNNRSVAIVADKLETARDELMNDVVEFIINCPDWLVPQPDTKDTQKLKRYDNGCQLSAFSSKGLRGYTPTLLFWDETAWTENSDKFWTSAKPTLQTGGRAIFVSTPSGLDPVFYKTFDAARRDPNHPFKAVELWWYNDPRYNIGLEWVKNKDKENEIRMKDENWDKLHRLKLKEDGWEATSEWLEDEIKGANGDMRKIAQEILCSFLGSGDNFIAEEFLKRIEDSEIKNPIRQEYVDMNFWIWEDYIQGEEYIMPIDASPGHGDDFSTINILKIRHIIEEQIIKRGGESKKIKVRKTKVEQVAEYYGKLTPQQLGEVAYQFGKRYNNAYAVVDITGGYGVQTIEKLIDIGYNDEDGENNIHYAEVTHKPSRDRLHGYIKKGQKTTPDGNIIPVDLIPGFFIGPNRPSVLLEMQRSIHMEDVTIHSLRLLNELKTFVTVPGNRVADHKRSFHDDSIMSLATGLYVLNFDMAKFRQNKGATKKMLDAMININDPEKFKELANKYDKENEKKIPPIRISNSDLRNYSSNAWLFKNLN